MSPRALIWDHAGAPPADKGGVILWRSYAEGASTQSVPRYVEQHGERLRARYLAFVHDLSEARIEGRSVVEHLNLGDGFSFWWMTQIAEKSPFKSPRIFACLRLLALEEMLRAAQVTELTLDSADRPLVEAVDQLCRTLGIPFARLNSSTQRKSWSLRQAYQCLPYTLQALISLRHLIASWPLRRLRRPQWFNDDRSIFLCSYFFNLDAAACANGQFHPRQWEGLPRHLRDTGRRANWIHHFLLDPGTPSAALALDWVGKFNQDPVNQGYHAFLETYLTWGLLFRAVGKWGRLNALRWRLRQISGAFKPRDSAAWLWPLLRHDWQASLAGPAAMNNCLWTELFDAALRDIPPQNLGLYIWENQGWECALLAAWRRHGHGKIIGVPHATVVFWHLNNFDDPRSLTTVGPNAKPLPDCLAVNGPMAWRAFVDTGYPAERLLAVEALRFQYLQRFPSGKPVEANPQTAPVDDPGPKLPKRILMLGDFTARQTFKMLDCVAAASQRMDAEILLTLKPHPVCPIQKTDYTAFPFNLTDKPLAEIMPEFDCAFCSNTSSAGLEALLAGLSVVIFLDDDDFNHSPLRGVGNIRFAGTPETLASALLTGRRSEIPAKAADFFWLDEQLPRWKRLLSAPIGDRI